MKLCELTATTDEIEDEALLHYLRDSYFVNSALRSRAREKSGESLNVHQQSKVDAIDRLFAKTDPLKEPLTLYRAIGGYFTEDWEVGMTFVDKGYVSTSSIKNAVHNPGYVHPDERIVLTIEVPSGVRAIEVDEVIQRSETASAKAKALSAIEHEYLLPRNLMFKVLSIKKKSIKLKVVK